jgi:hypothetical protein
MDQRSMNEAVQQGVRRCLESDKPLVVLQSFLGRLRHADWSEEAIGGVNNATRRMIAIIYEPESSESADEMQPGQKSPDGSTSPI